jgi:hypothetical protein
MMLVPPGNRGGLLWSATSGLGKKASGECSFHCL